MPPLPFASTCSPSFDLLLTCGEPAGIGPDIIIDLGCHGLLEGCTVIGDIDVLRARSRELNKELDIAEEPAHGRGIRVFHVACPKRVVAGQLDTANAEQVLATLDVACDWIAAGRARAMVTAPVHKGIVNQAGIEFSGHTEYLKKRTAAAQVVMMLMSATMRVALATTHLPLRRVSESLTEQLLEAVLRVLQQGLQRYFALPEPIIGVLGINPHAGEGGFIGDEEKRLIQPLIGRLCQEGMRLSGVLAADTAFAADTLAQHDVMLAMYHDQGLIPLKQSAFGKAVNVTLGLPFVRTSVDHGSALSLAGGGNASSSSLRYAIATARSMLAAADAHACT